MALITSGLWLISVRRLRRGDQRLGAGGGRAGESCFLTTLRGAAGHNVGVQSMIADRPLASPGQWAVGPTQAPGHSGAHSSPQSCSNYGLPSMVMASIIRPRATAMRTPLTRHGLMLRLGLRLHLILLSSFSSSSSSSSLSPATHPSANPGGTQADLKRRRNPA